MHKCMRIQETIGFTYNIAEGAEAPVSRTRSVTEAATTSAAPNRIVTVVEGIHTGLTRNKTFYPADDLEKAVDSWLNPYGRPVIKNHDTWEEPTGRVIGARFKQSQLAPEKHTIELDLEITDPDTIQKVLDGRYRTLSIGGSANSVVCSVCGKDIVKEGYCNHMKGRAYEGKVAHWIIRDLSFDEISWVNVPADTHAQVIHRNTIVKTAESAEEGGQNMDPANPIPAVTEDADNILDQIDATRVTENAEPEATPETPVAEGGEPETPATPETPETPVAEGGEPETPATPAEPSVEEQLAEANARIETLVTENTTLVAERDTLQVQFDEASAELTQAKENLAAADSENASLVKAQVTLATYAHNLLVESVANLSVATGQVEESGVDALKQTLVKESSRTLKDRSKQILADKPQRVVQTVANPGMAINDGKYGVDGEVTESTKPEDKEEFTIATLAEKLNKAFNRN